MDSTKSPYVDAPSTLFIRRPVRVPHVVVLSADAELCAELQDILSHFPARVSCIETVGHVLRHVECDLLLLDTRLPDLDMTALAAYAPACLLIGGDLNPALERVFGEDVWFDCLPFPAEFNQVRVRIRNALQHCRLRLDFGRMQQRLQHLRRLTQIARVGYWGWQLPTRVWQWGTGLRDAIGLSPTQIGETYESFLGNLASEDQVKVRSLFDRMCKQGGQAAIDCCLNLADGVRYLRLIIEAQIDGIGRPELLYGTVQDVGDHQRAQAMIRHQNQHDALTGLANKALFMERLQQAILQADQQQEMLAVLLINLDRFKIVNKHLSHEAGDKLLNLVGERLRSWVRDEDVVARIVGDEFGLLLPWVKSYAGVDSAVQRLERQMTQPFNMDGEDFFISMSIGIAIYPNDERDPRALVRGAEHAVTMAKQRGGRCAEYFTGGFRQLISERLSLESALYKALENHEIDVHYQPQVTCQDLRVIGVEALARWQHKKHGMVTPDRFIPIAEETGLINEIGQYVIETALQQLQQWEAAGYRGLRMGVNLSARQFAQENLLKSLMSLIRKSGLSAQQIDLEITESVAMQNAAESVALLNKLKRFGVHLSMDDFGTGYSSLSYLQQFPFDTIKIDKAFVQDIAPGSEGEIAKTVIAMARSLGKKVIAEGVETEYQLGVLREQACDEIQGFLVSKPLTAAQCEAYLAQHWR